jgi:hypothetical protein
MGNRRNRIEKQAARLVVKKETVRSLQSLSEADLKVVAGGKWGTTLPSCNAC